MFNFLILVEMKKIFSYCLLVIVSMSSLQVKAAKKEKNLKAEKEPYVWDWDGIPSGNEVFDAYLSAVTIVWNDVETYEKTFAQYNYNIDTITINGRYYLLAYMDDGKGNMITRNQVNWQVYNSVLAATQIVVNATSTSLLTAEATVALPALGMKAVKFAKYIKGGPMVIAKGMKEIGAIAKVNKANAKSWKAMKTAAIDPASLGYFSEEMVKKMNKCCYLKEIVETDPEYSVIETIQAAKSSEQLQEEAEKVGNTFETANVLPEDANQSLDDESFAGLDVSEA